MQFNNLGKQWEQIRQSALTKLDRIGLEGSYINGPAVSEFEQQFADYFDSEFAVGVSNGTDGLKIALQCFDLTSEDVVIMPANTFIADYLAVKNLPLGNPKVVLIDHDDYFTIDTVKLENWLKTNRNEFRKVVVIPVHLYGHPCDMDVIKKLSEDFDFNIIEDCSQSHETRYKEKHLGSFGDIAVYSLYPGKNLGACGDAGIITTNSEQLAKRLKSLRNYGSSVKYHYDELGHNHRLDSFQAIILLEKLKHLKRWTDEKNVITDRFLNEINNSKVELPKLASYCTVHSWHIFCVMVDDRKSFESHLSEAGIPTIIHYPIPISKTSIWQETDSFDKIDRTLRNADRIVSIPIHPFLSENDVDLIINTINSYF